MAVTEEVSQPFRALNSASKMLQRKLCPGSANAEQGMTEVRIAGDAAASAMGTFMHAKEQGMTEGELRKYQQRAIEKNKDLSKRFIQSTLLSLGIDDPGPAKRFIERDFFLNDAAGNPVYPPIPGHTDEIVWYPKVDIVFVFDSKFGRYPVTGADMNMQLRTYAVMVFDDLGAKRMFLAIRQPYLPEPLDFHAVQYLEEDIEPARAEILDIITKTQDENAPRVPGDACSFCKARGTPKCEESVDWVTSLKRAQVLKMKPETMEEYYEKFLLAQRIIDNGTERLREVAGLFPNLLKKWKLGEQQFTHNVDPAAAWAYASSIGLTQEQFLASCDVSLPKLREAVRNKLAVNEDVAKMLIHSELQDHIVSTPQKRKIVPKRK